MASIDTSMSNAELKETLILDMFYYDPKAGEIFRDPDTSFGFVPKSAKSFENWRRRPLKSRAASQGSPTVRFTVSRERGFCDKEFRIPKAKMIVILNTGVAPVGHVAYKDNDHKNCRFGNLIYRLPEGTQALPARAKVRLSPDSPPDSLGVHKEFIAEKYSIKANQPIESREVDTFNNIEFPRGDVTEHGDTPIEDQHRDAPTVSELFVKIIKKYVRF